MQAITTLHFDPDDRPKCRLHVNKDGHDIAYLTLSESFPSPTVICDLMGDDGTGALGVDFVNYLDALAETATTLAGLARTVLRPRKVEA